MRLNPVPGHRPHPGGDTPARFWLGIGISLAAHAAALAGLAAPDRRPQPVQASPDIVVRLVMPAPAPTDRPAATRPVNAGTGADPAPHPSTTDVPVHASADVARPAAVPSAPAPTPVAIPVMQAAYPLRPEAAPLSQRSAALSEPSPGPQVADRPSTPGSAGGAAPPAREPEPRPGPTGSAPSAFDRPEAAALPAGDAWYVGLLRQLRLLKRYPMSARRLRQEGVVRLAARIGGDGSLEMAEIRQGSGFALLDRAALDLLEHAVMATKGLPTPDRPTHLEIPIVYRLED